MIYVGSLLTVGVCAYAIHRGGEAERTVSIAALVALFGSLLGQTVLGRGVAWPVIGADVALSVALAVVTAIHLRPWLFVESALALALLLVHGAMASTVGVAVTPAYAASINGIDVAMLLVLAVATVRSRHAHDSLLAPADAA